MKRPRWKRLLRASLVLVVGPVVLGSLLLFFLVGTEGGTRWLFGRVGLLMKGAVTVDSLKGTLRSPLEITGLRYRTATVTVDIRTLRLRWRLGALLRRQLDVESIRAEGVRVAFVPAKDDTRKPLTDIHIPVNILIRQASLHDIVVSAGDAKEPLVIDSVDLATSAIGDKVRVDRLAVVSPFLDLKAEGEVTPLGDYPVSLRTSLTYRRAGMPPFEAKGSFSGSLAKLAVDQVLSLPFDAHLVAELTDPLSDLGVDGTLEFSGLEPRGLDPTWPEADLRGRLHLKGSAAQLAVEGTIGSSTGPLGPLDAELSIVKRADEIRVAALKVMVPGARTSVSGEGLVVLGEPATRLDLRGTWNELRWPLSGPGETLAISRRGTFSVRGTLDDYALALKGDLEGSGIPSGDWELEGSGNPAGMRISSFGGSFLGGSLGGAADLEWKPQVAWRVSVKGDGLDPGRRWAAWPGQIGFDARTTGKLEEAGPMAHVEIGNLRGSIRGQGLGGGMVFDLQGEQIQVRQLDLTAGGARAMAQGEAGRRNAFTWSLAAPNLASLLEGAGGAMRASGRVDGPRQALRVRGTLEGDSLSLQERRVARLRGTFDVDLAPSGAVVADVQATGVNLGGRSLDSLTLTVRGTRARHDLTLAALSKGIDTDPGESADLRLSGGWTGTDWRGELTRLDLSAREAGSWKLLASSPLVASAESFTLSGFCWASSGGRVCADGSWRRGGVWSVRSTITDLPLSLFRSAFPAGVTLTGALNGRVDAHSDPAGALTATVSLVPGPGEIRYGAGTEGSAVALSFRDAALDFFAGPTGAEGKLVAFLPETGTISGEIRLPQLNAKGVPREAQAVLGRLVVDLKSLSFLQAFSSQVTAVKGTARADLTFGGTLAAPTVLGTAALLGGQADVPDYGLQLRELTVRASGDGKGPLKIEGSVRSGEGKLSLIGTTPLIPGAAGRTSLSIQGERFQVMNTPEARVLVSPRVQVVVTAGQVDVSGDVEVPVARVEYERKFATVPLSRDVVFVGASAKVPGKQRAVVARVRLILGDQVRLKSSGFDAKISGSLLAFDQPGRETTGTGELEIKDGTYKAYGQDLTIERGRLFFAGGPIDNPGVDAKAFRRARDGVVAGILIRGSLRTPEVTVYSEPPMAQADALAYLVLGHRLAQATQQEGSLVTSAAASLGMKGGNLLAKKLAARFGLEEAKIETEGTYKEAALVLGKFLSPRLYVSYGIGLFDRVSTLRMSYILSPRWTLKAETGAASGADIVHTIER